MRAIMTEFQSTRVLTFISIFAIMTQWSNVSAFYPLPIRHGYQMIVQPRKIHCRNNMSTRHVQLSMTGTGFGKDGNNKQSSKNLSSSTSSELFELQELRAQLDTITKQNILNQSLSAEKRQELTAYVKTVIEKIDSPIDIKGKKNAMGIAQFIAAIEGKSWRMVFTTNSQGNQRGGSTGEGAKDAAQQLPFGSTVVLRIGQFAGTEGKLDYVLKFSKQVIALKELVAKSICSVDISPINPGLLTIQYQDIKTKIFGVANVPIGLFGLLKGRVVCLDTVWFDEERWIEKNYLESGATLFNVYVRDVQDEKEQKRKI